MTLKNPLEIIIAAYNNADFTRFTLDGYLRQTEKKFSVAIADDGSGPAIKMLVDEFREKGLDIRHVWHEDNGYRRAEIMNRAAATSMAAYIVLTDNDCIPSRCFVEDHKRAAEKETFVAGRRVDLGPGVTDEILAGETDAVKLEQPLWLIMQSVRRRLKRAEFGIRLPRPVSSLWSLKDKKVVGANMALWKDDFLRVNGFDNDFQGYGLEEVDLEWRLLACGLKRKSVLGRACMYHFYHPARPLNEENAAILENKKRQGLWCVENGARERQ